MSNKNRSNKPNALPNVSVEIDAAEENKVVGSPEIDEQGSTNMISITLTEDHFDDNPELAMGGLNIGDEIQLDEVGMVQVISEDKDLSISELSKAVTIDNFYDDMIHLMIKRQALNEDISIPVEYLVDFNSTNGMFHYFTPSSNVEEVTNGRVTYCQVKLEDLVSLVVTKNGITSTFVSIPTSYDIIKEQGATVAIFSKAGKLDFKDLFNLRMATLKSSL